MLTSLKNITERAQKCDFSVNFHILIEQTGFRSDILCQKVDITPHCVFPLKAFDYLDPKTKLLD